MCLKKGGNYLKRDIRIDALRALAIILIVLAHTSPPHIIQNIRTFDVPLITMILGMSFVLSNNKTKEKYSSYLIKRFKRLIIPAWIFITFFLFLFFVLSFAFPDLKHFFSAYIILTSYTLLSGINYVWIIRVFFTIAIFSPAILYISKKTHKKTAKYAMLLSCLMIQQALYYFDHFTTGKINLLYQQLIAISFAYMVAALVGMWAIKQTKKENFEMSCFFFFIFFIFGFLNHFSQVNDQKYPPSMYFLSYGLAVSLLLLAVITNKKIEEKINKKSIKWLSSHSLEFYYWHIIPITIIDYSHIELNWLMKFIIVVITAIFISKLQLKYIPNFFNPKLKRR